MLKEDGRGSWDRRKARDKKHLWGLINISVRYVLTLALTGRSSCIGYGMMVVGGQARFGGEVANRHIS